MLLGYKNSLGAASLGKVIFSNVVVVVATTVMLIKLCTVCDRHHHTFAKDPYYTLEHSLLPLRIRQP